MFALKSAQSTAFFVMMFIAFTTLGVPAQAQLSCKGIHIVKSPDEQATEDNQAKIRALLNAKELQGKISLSEATLKTVFSQDVRVFEARFIKVLESMREGKTFKDSLRALYESLYYPEVLIVKRLAAADAVSSRNVLSVLGDLSLAETMRLFVGDNPKEVAQDSLLGRYLAESGAQLLQKSFTERGERNYGAQNAPAKPAQEGPPRLVVPVTEASFPIFKKYFSTDQAYSVSGHANMILSGRFLPYSGQLGEMRFLSNNTPLPMVLLKTTEGARLSRYAEAISQYGPNSWGTEIKQPWRIPGYLSEPSRYNCCTQWHGNLPIGDKLVTKIILPGENDVPKIVKVNPPEIAAGQEYLKDIWTYPMHEPVSSVLGLAQNNGRGEFASPGWVIQSLLVHAPTNRVPFVILFSDRLDPEVPGADQLNFEQPW